MKEATIALVTILGFSVVGNVGAQTKVPDRTTLNTLLGASAMTETFEGYPVADGNDTVVGIYDLNSITGPVIPGFSLISSSGDGLQWNGNGYYGLPTETVLMDSILRREIIQFTSPVQAFGVDLLSFQGYGVTANALIYAANDTTVLGSVDGIYIGGGASTGFIGYADSAGIGQVVLTQNNWPWAPIIDNLEFGTTSSSVPSVPDSGSTALLAGIAALGLIVQWRLHRLAL